uniref:Uncharacterized protein n=1 Tax=Panagrolaimus sp. JU765 TaxID=591449 RepID=A0AC34RCK0_9BILA
MEERLTELSGKEDEVVQCCGKIEDLERLLAEKQVEIENLMNGKNENESLKKITPAIVDEMNDIYKCLSNVTGQFRKISNQKHVKSKKI